MPELPDLHVYAINLQKLVLDCEIKAATIHNALKVNAASGTFAAAIEGARITAIAQEGKELFFSFSSGKRIAVHLMLHGKCTVTDDKAAQALRGRVVSLTFADERVLSISDYANMCKVTLQPRPARAPDALSPAFDYAYLANAAIKHAFTNVKAFLIDQHIVRGIGNAYADEILYAADISPASFVAKLPPEALRALHTAIRDVLTDAIRQIQAIAPDIISGEERGFLKVHNSKRTVTEAGEPILVKDIASKRTYFTARQKLYG